MARIKDLVIQVMELYDKGYTLSKIALVTELSVDEVDQILSDYHEYYVPVYWKSAGDSWTKLLRSRYTEINDP